MLVDVVVCQRRGVDRLRRPLLVGDRARSPPATRIRRPAVAGSGAETSRCSASSPSTAAAPPRPQPQSVDTPKPSHVAACGGDPLPRVVAVQEAEVELGVRLQREFGQRREVLVVGARHGDVDPVERASEAGRQRVRDLDELACVARLDEVAVRLVAVAEMEPELDAGGDVAAQSQQPLEDAAAHVVEPCRRHAFEHRELEARVPLDRELIVRHAGEDPRDLGEHLGLVHGLEHAPGTRGPRTRSPAPAASAARAGSGSGAGSRHRA